MIDLPTLATADLHFGQAVCWTNRAGIVVRARIVDIVPGHDQVQIRVLHQRGAQLLWVRVGALVPVSAEGVAI
jgi:hypothetical protein